MVRKARVTGPVGTIDYQSVDALLIINANADDVARDSRAALIALHASVALFGFAALFGKWIPLPATAIVLGRSAVAALTLAIVARVRGRPLGHADATLAFSGAILALHWISFFAAIQIANVAIGLLGYAAFPVFVLVLERRFLVKEASYRDGATALLATVGLAALVPDFSWSSSATRGLALGLVSGFTFAWLTVRNRRLVADQPAMRIALWQNAFAAAWLFPIVAIADSASKWPRPADVGLLIVLGVACTALAHTLFIASMHRVSAHRASVVAALEPVYGIALAAWLLHEIPNGRTIVGGGLVVAAAFLASGSRKAGDEQVRLQ
jgi:drug/metabolite transporter (DMT)-like permease